MKPLTCFDAAADESLWASDDYFRMLRTGIIEEHARSVWRSFRDGYAAAADPSSCDAHGDLTRAEIVSLAGKTPSEQETIQDFDAHRRRLL